MNDYEPIIEIIKNDLKNEKFFKNFNKKRIKS